MQEKPREGELCFTVSPFGKAFTIYYGYYDDLDRQSGDPVPIYPDLKKAPVYTEDGAPIVTAMQIACPYYRGTPDEDSCGQCPFFEKADLLFGKCINPKCKK